MRRCWLLVCLAAWAWPAAASAASAVLLPVTGGDEAVSFEARQRAREIAHEVLEGARWHFFDAAEVAGELPPELERCAPGEACAFELRALLRAEAAVGISLYGQGDDVTRVEIVITGVRGVTHRTEATVDPEAGLPFAVAEPLRAGLLWWDTGRVVGPPGPPPAPLAVRVVPGVRLEPSPLNYFLGALFVAGSAPMLGYGINSAVRNGECVVETDAGCTQRVRFREGAAIFTGLGAATLLAGVLFLVLRPIPMLVQVSPEGAAIEARGTF